MAGLLGVELGVRRTEQGAIGVAEVVELFITERGAQQVEVSGRAVCVDETKKVPGVLEAGRTECGVIDTLIGDPRI